MYKDMTHDVGSLTDLDKVNVFHIYDESQKKDVCLSVSPNINRLAVCGNKGCTIFT